MEYCPWKLETEKQANFSLQIGHFMKTLVDASITYLTLLLALGFSITKLDFSLNECKFVFGMTAAKFMFGQVFSAMGTF